MEKINGSVGAGPRSYRKRCHSGTRKSKETIPEVAEKRAQPLHLRQRRRQEGSATLINRKGELGRGIKYKGQKGSDRGSGAHTHNQHWEGLKIAESYSMTSKWQSKVQIGRLSQLGFLGYCWDRPTVLYQGETFGPPI